MMMKREAKAAVIHHPAYQELLSVVVIPLHSLSLHLVLRKKQENVGRTLTSLKSSKSSQHLQLVAKMINKEATPVVLCHRTQLQSVPAMPFPSLFLRGKEELIPKISHCQPVLSAIDTFAVFKP